jgi:hypothetical protein
MKFILPRGVGLCTLDLIFQFKEYLVKNQSEPG